MMKEIIAVSLILQELRYEERERERESTVQTLSLKQSQSSVLNTNEIQLYNPPQSWSYTLFSRNTFSTSSRSCIFICHDSRPNAELSRTQYPYITAKLVCVADRGQGCSPYPSCYRLHLPGSTEVMRRADPRPGQNDFLERQRARATSRAYR